MNWTLCDGFISGNKCSEIYCKFTNNNNNKYCDIENNEMTVQDTSSQKEVIKLKTICANGYYLDTSKSTCSTGFCDGSGETEGKYYYEFGSVSDDKICTPCDGSIGGSNMKYLYDLICSTTRCTFFTNYSSFTNTTGTMNCSVSSCEYEVFGTATGSNLGYYYEDGSDKVCTKCDQTAPEATRYYLRELVCSATRCPFFTNYSSFTNTTGTMNCSVSSCEYEVFGTATGSNLGYYYEDGSDKVCTKCDQTAPEATRYYLRELICSATRCPFFTNYSSFTNTTGTMNCSVSSCEYEVFGTATGSNLGYYYEDGSDKVCTKCDQTAPEATRYYLRELVCSATRCPFFTNYSSFTNTTGTMNCSVSSCEYEVFGTATGSNLGYYYEDGSDKVCTKCDQTAPEATRYYLRELVCSATRCPFFTNYSSFTNTTGTMNCSVSSCEYEVFGTATGSNLGYYYEDGSDKVCTKCDQTAPEATRYYLRELVCSATRCPFFTNYSSFTNTTGTMNCSVSSCEYEVFGTATGSNLGYYYEDGSDKVCTKCDQTAPEATRYYLRELVCSATRCPFFTNYSSFTNTTGTMNCSVSSCEYEVFGTATGSNLGYYYEDGSDKVCTKCDQTAPEATRYYLRELVCSATRCPFFTNYSSFTNTTGTMNCSVSSCEYEVFGTATGSNLGYYYEDGSDKVCTKCDQTAPEATRYYLRELVCSATRCPFFTNYSSFTNTTGTMNCSVSSCEYEVWNSHRIQFGLLL
ncbi:Kazal-type_serine protease inhibitor [Hexamita inflata]|uniref:Kazal-type serine protease inhibitor n=1 Tax=Hexamita inflata TaxID=28002 RepID=A0AA86P4N0_9EUKA|nr:Kazal-type serine protease inhibitor [Hexamita inflata]